MKILQAIERAAQLAYANLTPDERAELASITKKLLLAFGAAILTLSGLGTYALLVGIHSAGGTPPGIADHIDVTQIVPAVGPQGYDVETFCNDPLTLVMRDKVAPPDSTYGATYTLDRTKGGVHETVFVGVYNDSSRQPTGTHYDSVNNSTDAFVSKAALDCIRSKAK